MMTRPDRRSWHSVRWTTLAAFLAALAGVLTLHAMGRTTWCACGALVPWSFAVWSSHNSQHLVDPYTLTHVLHGIAFYALFRLLAGRVSREARFALAIAAESLWEVIENTDAVIRKYREATMSLDYYGDSVLNSAGDIAACALGLLLAARLRPRWSVLLFAAFELGLLLTVRDSLLLNVLMLLHPVPAVKAWQVAGAP
jgi:hypothetical protein